MAGDGVSSYVYKPVSEWDKTEVADWLSSIAPFARDTVSKLMLDEVRSVTSMMKGSID